MKRVDHKRKNDLIADLEIIRNKGNCNTTLWKAYRAYHRIVDKLTPDEALYLGIALGHKEMEGAEELNDVLKTIRNRIQNKVTL